MPSGESGIRTHAPFRTNGFQDRLVMTTSISLRMCVLSLCHLCCSPDDKSYSNKKVCYCQHIFTQFLFYFFNSLLIVFLFFAERTGFEPVIRFWRIHAFQACLFNHSSTSPFSNQPEAPFHVFYPLADFSHKCILFFRLT